MGLGRDSRERHVPNQALQVTYCGIAMDIAIQLLEMFLGRGAGFDDDLWYAHLFMRYFISLWWNYEGPVNPAKLYYPGLRCL